MGFASFAGFGSDRPEFWIGEGRHRLLAYWLSRFAVAGMLKEPRNRPVGRLSLVVVA